MFLLLDPGARNHNAQEMSELWTCVWKVRLCVHGREVADAIVAILLKNSERQVVTHGPVVHMSAFASSQNVAW
jgi:hypothetical protein